ncbi:aspartyl protease family protein [Salinimicrobium flavum]|uniref:Aspartyl protease family protein n=1 Tax=Salinimicrobium flavum TaxID=1737065 RepID=A0ABW5ISL4_9FLAO
MLKTGLFILLFICNTLFGYCQEGFVIEKGRKQAKIKFQLVSNLIIIPVELNGVELSFLLDTGVNTTVLLNLEEADSLQLRDATKIELRGLGGEEIIEAYKSEHNRMKIGRAICNELTLFLIYDEDVNFSPRLGIPVHGIIGTDFFKDFIVEINYARKFLRIHDPERFRKNLKRYTGVPLQFFQNKPYVRSKTIIEGEEIETVLLIDNGLGDALWLFNENSEIKIPEKSFEDFLGLGLLGDVTGKRSRITSFELGGHKLEQVTAAFPDSASVQGLRSFEERNGSLGGEILRRFNLVFDYSAAKMYLRKNRNFGDDFNYDMSGITLEHSGFVVVETFVKVLEPVSAFDKGEEVITHRPQLKKTFALQPAFTIVSIRKNSPAERAGLEVGDKILSVNAKPVYKYHLEDLNALFSSAEGKRIKIKVKREEEELDFEFFLEKLL